MLGFSPLCSVPLASPPRRAAVPKSDGQESPGTPETPAADPAAANTGLRK
jgi:hypothetical protein